jgi:hypothetical protein
MLQISGFGDRGGKAFHHCQRLMESILLGSAWSPQSSVHTPLIGTGGRGSVPTKIGDGLDLQLTLNVGINVT